MRVSHAFLLLCLLGASCGGGGGSDSDGDGIGGDLLGSGGGTLAEQVAAVRAQYVSDGGILTTREALITRILDEGGCWGAVVGYGGDYAFHPDSDWVEWNFVDMFWGSTQWISTGTVNGYQAAEMNFGLGNGDEDVPGMVVIINEEYWIHITGFSYEPHVAEYAPGGSC